MTLMRFREMTLCRAHRRAIVVLEDAEGRVTLTFYADPQEASRLARLIQRGPQACHPVFDFVRGLLGAFEAGVTRVVIDDVPGEGIGSVLHVQWAGAELAVLSAGRTRHGVAHRTADLRHGRGAGPRPAAGAGAGNGGGRRRGVAAARETG